MLNKIDRLILELRLTPQQAYERMRAIITQVNLIISAFQSEQYMSEADAVLGLQDAAAARYHPPESFTYTNVLAERA